MQLETEGYQSARHDFFRERSFIMTDKDRLFATRISHRIRVNAVTHPRALLAIAKINWRNWKLIGEITATLSSPLDPSYRGATLSSG